LNQVNWRHIRFLVDFTSCRLAEKGFNGFSKKKEKRARSARPTQATAGPAQLARTRAGAGFKRLTGGPRPSVPADAEPVRNALSRPIKSGSTALGRLLPPAMADRDETLAGSGKGGGSPRGFPRRRGWDRATRRTPAIRTRGGTADLDAGMDRARPRWGRPIQMLDEVPAPVLLDQGRG
jgi:hypothetical protein